MRDKHITNLEDKNHDGTKRIDPTTATPTTVLRHAVDITKVKYLNYGHSLNSQKSNQHSQGDFKSKQDLVV